MKRLIKLDIVKIRKQLSILGKDHKWLSAESGVGRQWLYYDFKTGCPNRADKYAAVFGLDPKDLIK